ncbi:MAG TPA: HNH endonuclease, partial [Mycobacterium sp.]|nr:HNH endonuclease [Mycobacterium sp.]
QPSATLWPPGHEPTVPTSDGRGAMMPTRRRTRADNRARRIQAERKLNDDYLAERNKPPPF